jgi:hypothetical protein
MFGLGLAEAALLPIVWIIYLAPIAAAVWVIVTQRRMAKKLNEIERMLLSRS